MYRLFCLSDDCRLYQLSSSGWVTTEGTNFMSLKGVASFLMEHFVPSLPCGSAMLDSYVAEVDGSGTIIRTMGYAELTRGN